MKPPSPETETQPGIRLDIWLWAARLCKTRSLAKTTIQAGRVTVGGQYAKAARRVHVGEIISAPLGHDRIELTVLGLSDQRGPAPQAQLLYRETEASVAARAAAAQLRRDQPQFTPPPGKPDKQARRKLIGFLDA